MLKRYVKNCDKSCIRIGSIPKQLPGSYQIRGSCKGIQYNPFQWNDVDIALKKYEATFVNELSAPII